MADENEKSPDDRSEELYTWISMIPSLKQKKNLPRDFSDAVLMAEILKVYYPRYVDLHNYVPANSLTTKKENWGILNRKVFSKIDMKLSKDTISQLANSHPGVAEHLLLELRDKVLCNDKEKGKNKKYATIEENSCFADRLTAETECSRRSIYARVKERLFFIVQWLLSWLCVWNYFPSIKFRKESTDTVSRTENTWENRNVEDGSIPHYVCTQLKQELCEKDDIICTLNRKVEYLESAMKVKDLRISNLASQILQNAVDSEQLGKVQTNNDTQIKSRFQLLHVRDKFKVEE
ncbi:uncharacterized protein LOC122396556 [Colletes gigas]|uniref:uncharacterized protein LOC122396556 n=1 Tax=Colletes gigas TaxID=935657 RepID=UPI001C9AC3B9|nr:uncharacterized protein LOC122396556 [Colletes gigas]